MMIYSCAAVAPIHLRRILLRLGVKAEIHHGLMSSAVAAGGPFVWILGGHVQFCPRAPDLSPRPSFHPVLKITTGGANRLLQCECAVR